MPSINLELDYFDHPKVRRLVSLLGPDADVLPIRLWAFTGKFYFDAGRIRGVAPEEIELGIRWRGKPGQCVAALVQAGILEIIGENDYQVHDWLKHQGHIVRYKKRAIKAAEARWIKSGTDPPYATSIAKVAHKQCLRPALQCLGKEEGGSGEGEKPPPAARTECADLAQRFCFAQSPRKDDEIKVAAEFQAMIDSGEWSLAEIAEAIKTNHDRSRYWWQVRRDHLEKPRKINEQSKGSFRRLSRVSAKDGKGKVYEKRTIRTKGFDPQTAADSETPSPDCSQPGPGGL